MTTQIDELALDIFDYLFKDTTLEFLIDKTKTIDMITETLYNHGIESWQENALLIDKLLDSLVSTLYKDVMPNGTSVSDDALNDLIEIIKNHVNI